MITTVSDPNFQEGLITPGCESTAPRTVGDFVDAFSRSSHNKDVQDSLDEGVKGERSQELTPDLDRKVHRTALQSPLRQFGILFSRSVRLIVAQPVTFVVTVLANVVFGLILGSIFFNVDETEAGAFSRVRFLRRAWPCSAPPRVSWGLRPSLLLHTLMLAPPVSVPMAACVGEAADLLNALSSAFLDFLCCGCLYVCDSSACGCTQGGLLFLGMLFLAFGEGTLRVFFAERVDAKRTFFLGCLRERRQDPSYWLALLFIGIACCRTASLTMQGLVLCHTGRSVVFFLCVFSHSWILAFQVW